MLAFFVCRLAGAVELYSNLGGVTVQSMQGDSVVLLIQSDAQPGDEPGTPLILTIRFRLEGGVHVVFAGAEVNRWIVDCNYKICFAG